ncbi:sensor histidine kinase [Accumulibacter sp.]|uniref:sensor histidine kinase n=1 Tax=Accumulibacter sp. TaxID=2053492 RepID=UPI0025FB5949|nr:sensor histidine kinase [Accumulibacter sp.]MCM8597002.1 sensor histidine kinase [Accumulibacter sp.]MCM8626252.1 sensor histidine kinase [Accumulibacter sp.]MDS4051151.1 sensor histidine kinase [Accumulibacter sp.]
MPARGSLRLRLLAGTLFGVAALIVVAGWGLDNLFREHVARQFRAELATHLDQLTAHLVVDEGGRPKLSAALSDPRFSRPDSGLYWQIDPADETGAGGALRSRSLWDDVLGVPADVAADGTVHEHRLDGPGGIPLCALERRVHFEDTPDSPGGHFRLIVAADERLMAEPVARFRGALWIALGLLSAGLGLAALIQVIVGLAPLRQLRIALARVHEGSAQRLEGEFPAEVMPLIDDFNSVLARNAEVVERARTQAGNLAHALKTPLSVLANASAGREDELAALVRAQVAAAQRHVQSHLARAKAAAAASLPGARTALRPVVDGLLRTMHRLHAARSLDLVAGPIGDSLVFRGEEQDLQEMLGNLLDNACKWARSRVEISAGIDSGAGGTSLLITIDDDGCGIPASQRDAVLRRGVRADERIPGSGLGLSIADDLAQLYGGRLLLGDSPLGGLRARLRLPAASPAGALGGS